MTDFTIADRRTIMPRSMTQPDFRDLLRRDPRAAIAQATGRTASAGARVSVIEEQGDAWEFVLPAAAIDADLPAPHDARGTVDNDVYALLRDQPATQSQVVRDHRGFLAEHLNFDIGDTGITVREEAPGELLLILPYGDSREELRDAALEMVAGGGDPGCQSGYVENPYKTISLRRDERQGVTC